MKRFARPLLALAFAAALDVSEPAAAVETGRPVIVNFFPKVYKGHNQMWAATQGRNGLLYFANRGAVFEHDGVTWRRIEVPTSFVRALALGDDGHVYVGAIDQLGRLENDASGAPVFRSLLAQVPAELKPLNVCFGAVAHEGSVFFVFLHTILRWDGQRFTHWKDARADRIALAKVGPRLWLHRRNLGLAVWDRGDFRTVDDTAAWTRAARVHFLPADDAEAIALVDDRAAFRLRGAAREAFALPLADALARAGINVARRLRNGSYALGTSASGVFLFDARWRPQGHITEAAGLENDQINGLFEDAEQSLWALTNSGVSRIEHATPCTMFDRGNGLRRDYVSQVLRHQGTLYAVATTGFFKLVPGDLAADRPARFDRIPYGNESFWALASHESGLLVGERRGVLLLRDGAVVPQPIHPLNDPALVLRLADGDRNLLFVGRGIGLDFLRYEAGQWRLAARLPGFNAEVRSLQQDADGALWLGTSTRGIVRVRRPPGEEDWARAVVTTFFETHGLPAGQGWSMVWRTPLGLLFSTRRGAYRFDPAGERFIREPELKREGKDVKFMEPVVTTDDGTIWTQTELADAPDASLVVGSFTREAGGRHAWRAQPYKINQLIGWGGARMLHWDRSAAGDVLWISGADGTLRLELDRAFPPVPPWRTLLRSVQWPGREALVPAESAAAASPEFPYTHEPLTISFAATRFAAGAPLQFRTRLLGFSGGWSAWSPRTEASFTNLVGGPFTFEAQARDAEGNESAPARFTFSVAPPWHRRGAAFALYAAALAGAVAGFVRWRLRAAERERTRLERLVAQRTEELRQAKNAADDASRAKSAFLANMSHELRTPLNGVIGYAQVLMNDRDLSPKNRERIQVVQTSGEHLLRMINEVLDFSKIEAGRMELQTTAFHLPQLLRDVAAGMSARVEQKGLEFIFDPAPDLPDLVLGDPLKLRQVLDNLLGNAVKFTPRGTIRFEARPADAGPETVWFAVADTGVGIGEADRARLFQPFQQAVDARPPEPGTGLGLAISQRMVELMGGTLGVASTPGAGSTFSFVLRLPVLAADAAAEKTATRITGYRGRRRRLLIADDVATNRHVLRELLEPLGFEVSEAASGGEALALVTQAAPDLVLLDLRMPGLDGFELARRVRAQAATAHLKLIAMSASVLSFNREQAFAAGCDDFLPKPFREGDLLARLGLALQLEWTAEPAGAASHPGAPANPLATGLPPAVLAQLLACARRGEIAQLRRLLADHAADPLAAALDALARSYRMEQIREILERQCPAPPASP